MDNGRREETRVEANGDKSIWKYDADDEVASAWFSDGGGLASSSSTKISPPPPPRESVAASMLAGLADLTDPIKRGDLLNQIIALYVLDSRWPSDYAKALELSDMALKDPSLDNLSKAGTLTRLVSASIGRHKDKAKQCVEALFDLTDSGLSADRTRQLKDMQNGNFKILLALNRGDSPEENLRNWRKILKKYGSTEQREADLKYMIGEEHLRLSGSYLKNQHIF